MTVSKDRPTTLKKATNWTIYLASQQYEQAVDEGPTALATEYRFATSVTVRDVDEAHRSGMSERPEDRLLVHQRYGVIGQDSM